MFFENIHQFIKTNKSFIRLSISIPVFSSTLNTVFNKQLENIVMFNVKFNFPTFSFTKLLANPSEATKIHENQRTRTGFLTNSNVNEWKSKISCFLINLNGTVYVEDKNKEKTLTPRAVMAYIALKTKEKKYKFVTNTSRDSLTRVQHQLASIGFGIPKEEIFSSLTSTKDYLIENGLRPHLLISDDVLGEEFSHLHALLHRPNCVVVGLAPEKLNYASINKCFQILARDRNRKLIAINTGRHCMTPEGLSLGAGPFVKTLESASMRQAVVVGKPSKEFYLNALKSLGVTDPLTAVMIGDDVKDDVIAAIEAGLHGCLVKTGKYREGDELMAITVSQGEVTTQVPVVERCLVVETFADAISSLVMKIEDDGENALYNYESVIF